MYFKEFLKVEGISPNLKVGDPDYNVREIIRHLKNLRSSVVCFPELAITGASCKDFFFFESLYKKALEALKYLLDNNPFSGLLIVGSPFKHNNALYNSAFVIQGEKVLGIIPWQDLSAKNKWFENSFNTNVTEVNFYRQKTYFGKLIFKTEDEALALGITIGDNFYMAEDLSTRGANLIINLNSRAANWQSYFKQKCEKEILAEKMKIGFFSVNSGSFESTSETVSLGQNIGGYQGNFYEDTDRLIVDFDLKAINHLRKNNEFKDTFCNQDSLDIKITLPETLDFSFERDFDKLPFVPKKSKKEEFLLIEKIVNRGLLKRLDVTKLKKIVLGVSGGLDSTLALLLCYRAFKLENKNPKDIICITMPCFPTSEASYDRTLKLAKTLGVTLLDIKITEEVKRHFTLIGQDINSRDITYENSQARYRTLVLMNLANKEKALVIGTGDLSEIALGFSTYNGDQMSMYNVNAGITKTLARFMVMEYINIFPELANLLEQIVKAKISPELKENQNTEDILGLYEINDFILDRFLTVFEEKERLEFILCKAFKLSLAESKSYVNNFLSRFVSSQFKRAASPDGPRVGRHSLSSREGFFLNSDLEYQVK